MARNGAQISRVAREKLGFDELRPGQREAVESLLAGRDTLVVMSTGSGKSAIYQLAALMLEGPTLVVSPLISLQRDQVESIEAELPGEAAALDGSLTEGQRRRRLRELALDDREFLFLAPEQLARAETVDALRAARPSLLVVDEAHCISEWGHDFRPDYLRLGALVEALGHPTVCALTATASPPVRDEIVTRLGMDEPVLVVRGFDRPGIWLGVERFREADDKRRALLDAVAAAERPGIVYVATRREADELARELSDRGLAAEAYHAGLGSARRDEIQSAFMDDALDAIVATTAFGMGVDKPNVRFVFHAAPSESLDAYYQEIGRAGRDERPARALLFYRPEDLGVRRFFASGGRLDAEQLEEVADAVREARGPLTADELRERTELSESKLMGALTRLEEAGALDVRADGRVEREDLAGADAEAAVEEAADAEADRRRFDRSRVEMVRAYAEHPYCRRSFVLSYFGEPHPGSCGNCDNCDAGRGEAEAASEPFGVGARVAHEAWGEGVVQRYDGDGMVVLFDSVGYKTLSVALVEDRGLLHEA
ncbi:MAG: RecQ family ATP-dependent DNA helicase [Nocardioidaceae bacterium]